MLTEEDIRSRTKTIFDAYKEMSGVDISPDISDFLKIRMEAISELGGRIVDMGPRAVVKTEAKPQPQRNNASWDSVQDDPAVSPVKDSVVSENTPVQTPPAGEENIRKEVTGFEPLDTDFEKKETPAPKPKSPFEILRSIKDPWN